MKPTFSKKQMNELVAHIDAGLPDAMKTTLTEFNKRVSKLEGATHTHATCYSSTSKTTTFSSPAPTNPVPEDAICRFCRFLKLSDVGAGCWRYNDGRRFCCVNATSPACGKFEELK